VEGSHVQMAVDTGIWARPARHAPALPGPSLPAHAAPHTDVAGSPLKALERDTLRALAAAHTGSRAELAARLGISERSLYRKLKALD